MVKPKRVGFTSINNHRNYYFEMKKILLTALLLFLTSINVNAQQSPHYTQYMYNMNVINPAYAGSKDNMAGSFMYRQQWVGLEGAPKTATFSIHSPVGKNVGLGLLTSVKRMQVNYSESNSTFLPGYIPTPGFLGTLKPTAGFTFGSQRDIRRISAENGWLTTYDQFNQQYTETHTQNIDFSINMEPISDLKIDLTGGKTYATNFTESFNAVGNTFNSLLIKSEARKVSVK